jgi:CBS domain-containing protein
MKVKDLMAEVVFTCTPEAPLSEAARIMWERDCGIVPVVDGTGRVAGVVTDRDACMAALTQGRPLSEIPVRSAMATGIHTCHPDHDVAHAEKVMRTRQILRLPVVDDADRLVGLLSLNDIARRALEEGNARRKQGVAETLGHVSRHRLLTAV